MFHQEASVETIKLSLWKFIKRLVYKMFYLFNNVKVKCLFVLVYCHILTIQILETHNYERKQILRKPLNPLSCLIV